MPLSVHHLHWQYQASLPQCQLHMACTFQPRLACQSNWGVQMIECSFSANVAHTHTRAHFFLSKTLLYRYRTSCSFYVPHKLQCTSTCKCPPSQHIFTYICTFIYMYIHGKKSENNCWKRPLLSTVYSVAVSQVRHGHAASSTHEGGSICMCASVEWKTRALQRPQV